jgi:hypothetical protein
LFKFIGAIIDQTYDIHMIIFLVNQGQNIFALLFLLADLIPGLLIAWQKFVINEKRWKWKILLFVFHPANMLVWPIIVAVRPNKKNQNTFEVKKTSIKKL